MRYARFRAVFGVEARLMSTVIALVTYLESPGLTESDARLQAALQARGHDVSAVAWDDPHADWQAFDAIIVRSPWDYSGRVAEFRAWLDRLEADGVGLANPIPVMRWNMHKRYLLELEAADVAVVPTEFVADASASPYAIAKARGWDEVVVKPAISAGARRTRVLPAASEAQGDWWEGEFPADGVLVQPLVRVIAAGEWSLIFFAGEFSHSALKVPAAGDFRVQPRHGGSVLSTPPSAELIAEGRSALLATAKVAGCDVRELLYARVDGVVVDGRFLVMEVELIEPGLFLDIPGAEHAADQFAAAIETWLLTRPARAEGTG